MHLFEHGLGDSAPFMDWKMIRFNSLSHEVVHFIEMLGEQPFCDMQWNMRWFCKPISTPPYPNLNIFELPNWVFEEFHLLPQLLTLINN
jgi:hypothetical protein